MTKQMENKILESYPFLAHRDYKGSIIEGELMGLEIPKGWLKLFLQMCEDIKPHLEKANLIDRFYFIQVKEKYNYLRCYHNGAPPIIENIIGKYEYMARNVCVMCGRPAVYETNGYIASFCNDCWKDYSRHEPGASFTPKTSYKVIHFSNKERVVEEISFEEEWNRYLKENNL